MISISPLAAARIGGVGYLNSKPLMFGIEPFLRLGHPSVLAQELFSGVLHGALVPVFEALAHPGEYVAVDGVGIVARGTVYSVVIAHVSPLQGLASLALDPASLTSVNLTKVVFAEFLKQDVEFRPWDGVSAPAENEGVLMIGDQAIRFRHIHPELHYLDLGEIWTQHTGLPFVFALWILRTHCPALVEIADALRQAAAQGIERLDEIREGQSEFDPEFVRSYLGGYIQYEIAEPEKAAIRKYGELLTKHQLIAAPPPEFRWI